MGGEVNVAKSNSRKSSELIATERALKSPLFLKLTVDLIVEGCEGDDDRDEDEIRGLRSSPHSSRCGGRGEGKRGTREEKGRNGNLKKEQK